METIKKDELVSRIAEATKFTKRDSEVFIKAFTETVMDAVAKGEKVQMVGFGSFEQVVRKEKKGRNPKTQEELIIPETKAPKFKSGKEFKDRVRSV